MKTLFFTESSMLFVIITVLALMLWAILRRGGAYVLGIYITVLGFLLYFYRVPQRELVRNEDVLLAASDGTVKEIVYDKDTDTYRVVAFLHIFNQHLQFYPISGTVKETKYKTGSFHPAYLLQKSRYNERMETSIETPHGIVKVTQIAGQIARRIVNHSVKGEHVTQGDYMGMIKLSSRVDIEFPATIFTPKVKIGDILKAKETIIATSSK